MADSSKNGSSHSDALYKGWTTGFSYRACRDIYWPNGQLLDFDRADDSLKKELLSLLETYLNVVEDWGVADAENLLNGLKNMVLSVERGVAGGVTLKDYDTWHEELKGAMRAKVPFASYADYFAATLSYLGHFYYSKKEEKLAEDVVDGLVRNLGDALAELKRVIPTEAYEIVRDILNKLDEMSQPKIQAKKVSEQARGMEHDLASLILTSKLPDDFLRGWENAAVVLGFGVVAGLVAIPIALAAEFATLVVPWLQSLSGLNTTSLNNVAAAAQSIVPLLAGVGLTASVVGKKAWDVLKGVERWGVRHYAKQEIWKNGQHVQPSNTKKSLESLEFGSNTAVPQ